MKILIPIIFTIVALILMAAALHFAKYKKRKQSGCCGAHDVCMHNHGNGQEHDHNHDHDHDHDHDHHSDVSQLSHIDDKTQKT